MSCIHLVAGLVENRLDVYVESAEMQNTCTRCAGGNLMSESRKSRAFKQAEKSG